MLTHIPLDDRLNRLYYVDGALCRLVYSRDQRRCVLRKESPHIAFEYAATLIAAGDLLWSPPDQFDRLDVECVPEAVRHERALINAFLRSPAGRRLPGRAIRRNLEDRIADDTAWLIRHAAAWDVADALDEDEDTGGR